MVFVPFTGIDNHRKSVTFAFGMLSNENTESFVWLLDSFMKAFGKQPRVVVTDEDGAMKNAIERVFPDSLHKLCMWHIGQKVPVRVCRELDDDRAFKKRFHKLIWNSTLDENNFDSRWMTLIRDFKLEENAWLTKMFRMRASWIPAYFRDVPFCGLMRTTSRSESANSAYSKVVNPENSLLVFMKNFEAAIDKQRHNQIVNDHNSNSSSVRLKTSLEIEKHARNVFTNEVFKEVQKEIYDSFHTCTQQYMTTVDDSFDKFSIMELRDPSKVNQPGTDIDFSVPEKALFYTVVFNKKEKTFDCSCMLFVQYGFLCRHVFCVFRTFHVNQIPPKYAPRRWMKNIIPLQVLTKRFSFGESSNSSCSLSREVFKFVEDSVLSFNNDQEKIKEFFDLIKEAKTKLDGDSVSSSSCPSVLKRKSDIELIEASFGVNIPPSGTATEIENPAGIRNKGTGKRFKGPREEAIEASSKKRRSCSICNQVGHNSRSCKVRLQREAEGREAEGREVEACEAEAREATERETAEMNATES